MYLLQTPQIKGESENWQELVIQRPKRYQAFKFLPLALFQSRKQPPLSGALISVPLIFSFKGPTYVTEQVKFPVFFLLGRKFLFLALCTYANYPLALLWCNHLNIGLGTQLVRFQEISPANFQSLKKNKGVTKIDLP